MFHYDLFKRIRDDLCSGLSKPDIVSQCNDDMEIRARQFPVFGSRIMNGSYLIFWPAINFFDLRHCSRADLGEMTVA
ncbi:MAG: hypothetical protein ACFB03_14905 [Paracoccaceae bacterium]